MFCCYYSIKYRCVICGLNNFHYLYQFRWPLFKKASQVLYLHCALKQCEFLEEFHEKQEQISAICVTISRRYMLEEATERIGGTIHAFELADADDATVMASVKIDL